MRRIDVTQVAVLLGTAAVSLAVATGAVWALERLVGVANASVVYVAPVVVAAIVAGTPGAVVTAVGAFLVYDFFFTQPYYTLTISDPGEWLSLVLLVFVAIVVGHLAALQRARTRIAVTREREARDLFRVSRELATRDTTHEILPTIATTLCAAAAMERVWIALGADDPDERVAADTGTGPAGPGALYSVLHRLPDERAVRWVRVHRPLLHAGERTGLETFRVRITAGDTVLGSIWATRPRARGEPDAAETRLLAAVADQLGQALAHDRLAAEAQAAEIARQSDALKSALLQSVSHDLRTPLATIRAAAGTLRPGSGLSPEDQQASADAIDREVEYLNHLVTNLLDLSRIEAGALRAERDVFELDDLVGRTLERLRSRLADRPLEVQLDAPPVNLDPIFLDEAVTNVVENAIKHTPPGTPIRIRACAAPDPGFVRLAIEDAGEGVPEDALGRLFDKFYRVPGRQRGSRSGTGIGLAVARGLVEATGGHIRARHSELGGLAVELDLPAAAAPATTPVAPSVAPPAKGA